MSGTILIIAACIVIMIAAFVIESRFNKKQKKMPEFQRKGPLFTVAEREFLDVLELAVGREGRVFGMVRVADVLKPMRSLRNKEWRYASDWMQNAHFNFVICDPETMLVTCAIELRDDSNPRNDKDKILKKACATAGLSLVQLPWQPDYSIPEIRALVLTHLSSAEMSLLDGSDDRIPIRPSDYT